MDLSIIIPVYNVEKYIKKCLMSVVNQTYRKIEIIIVNDGTEDKSMDIIHKIIEGDNRIKVINKANGGLMSAWIEGVKNASGRYIGFVDSDDWIDSDFFEYLLNKIKDTNSDMVVGKYVCDNGDNQTELFRSKDMIYNDNQVKKLLDDYFYGITYKENIISYCRWDKIYKREIVLNNIQYLDTRISLGEDINANAAIIPDCKKILVLASSPHYHYRTNEKSIVNTFKPEQIKNIAYLYDALYHIIEEKSMGLDAMQFFVADMIFNQIRLIVDCKDSKKEKYLQQISEYENTTFLLHKYAEKKKIYHRIFIRLFLAKRYKMCEMIAVFYECLKRMRDKLEE